MKTFTSAAELKDSVGAELGHSSWHRVEQDQINLFADATGDHQWIHVDPERAKAGPFGTTIAHGYLTLSLIPMLVQEIYEVKGMKMGVNYGLNKVRFPAPLPTGSNVRARATLAEITEIPDGLQAVTRVEIETEGGEKPCCVAETVARLYI